MRWVEKNCVLYPKGILTEILDYGCGKGFDADYYGMDKYDVASFPKFPKKKYDVIVCNYVLNVVDSSEEEKILNNIKTLLKKKGKAFIAVRRDLPWKGKQGRGCWQRFVTLSETLLFENKSFAIYCIDKS